MAIQEWEAMSATLLWINLRSGVLPIGSEIHGIYEGEPTRRGTVLSPAADRRLRLAKVDPGSIGKQTAAQHLCQVSKSTGRRRFPILPRLRVVWSRRKRLDKSSRPSTVVFRGPRT
jgi:hypothetical protein